MIFSNVELESEELKYDFGTIYAVKIGEKGRGRKFISINVPQGTTIIKGINKEFTIGQTKSGKPKILNNNSGSDGLILSSHYGYTRRGCGRICGRGSLCVLGEGYGADGAAGRIGRWAVGIYQVTKNKSSWWFVRKSGSYNIDENELIYWDGTTFSSCKENGFEDMVDHLDIDVSTIPFEWNDIITPKTGDLIVVAD